MSCCACTERCVLLDRIAPPARHPGQGRRLTPDAFTTSNQQPLHYQDFIIRFRDFRKEDASRHSFIVEVVESPLGRQVNPRAHEPSVLTVKQMMSMLGGETDELSQRGKTVADYFLPPNVLFWLKASLFQTIIRREGLRIILWFDDPVLARLPFEYLYVNLPTFKLGHLALSPLTTIIRDQPFFGLVEEGQAFGRR